MDPSKTPSVEQLQVAWLAANNMSNREIAQTLGCCQKNVEKHLTKLYKQQQVTRDTLHQVFTQKKSAY